jgi:hypothetical protein
MKERQATRKVEGEQGKKKKLVQEMEGDEGTRKRNLKRGT